MSTWTKLTRCSCITLHCNRLPPRSQVHEAAVLQSETITGKSNSFWSWNWGCTLHVLLNLNHWFISHVIKVPSRAFMMCAASRIEFASEPLELCVSAHVTGLLTPSQLPVTSLKRCLHQHGPSVAHRYFAIYQTQWTSRYKCRHSRPDGSIWGGGIE